MTNQWTPLADRLWERITKGDGCWLWTGGVNARGYGRVMDKGRPLRAHRALWQVLYGPIPDGLEVCHRCNVKLCVRPDHLYLGTHAMNMADASRDGLMNGKPGDQRGRHGRHARGSVAGRSKLTEADVLAIRARRAAGESGQALAAAYGVSKGLISHIVTRRIWQHI